MEELAEKIFDAWQLGEQTGNYELFKSFLSDTFILFTHPLLGKFENENALSKIKDLITEREKISNNLLFSEIEVFINEFAVSFHFNSKGTVQNGAFQYEGYNIITLHFEENILTGFQEYFGFINKKWFN
jgi:hypothetical protein